MSDKENQAGNLDADRDASKPICIIHLKEVCLYCKDCADILCIDCLVETHQTHPVAKIEDALDTIIRNVDQWCKETSTLSGIRETKDKLQNLRENSKQAEISTQSDLRKIEKELKLKIEEDANKLSKKLKDAFQKYESKLHRRLDEITECEKRIENFDVNSTSHANILQLYCRIRKCTSKEFQTEIETQKQPSLFLSTDTNVSIGNVKPDPDDDRVSQVAKIDIRKEENKEENKVYPIRIANPPVSSYYQEVSKIVPIRNEEAWVIKNKQLYFLNQSKFQASSDIYPDDIAGIENGNLIIMTQSSKTLNLIDAKWTKTVFTYTDPYHPRSVTYDKKSSSLMVLLSNSTVTVFDLNGIKKQCIKLPANVEGCCMAAISVTEFSIVHIRRDEQKKTVTNSIVSFSGNPLRTSRFSGIFGCNPELKFICKGICYDNQNAIIVSDHISNTVYKLDDEFKLQKVLLDREAGLEQPTALALKDGLLWVAEKKCILIYKYSEIE